MNVLEVRNLVKTFPTKEGYVRAVDGISFDIKKGEIFGLLGVNGAGKSTTINMLSGLILQNRGTIKIFGKDLKKHDEEIKGKFNLATAYYGLSHNLTVLQNLKVYAGLYNVKNPKRKIRELGERFMITNKFKTKVSSLSSGERSRLVLVKSLLNSPRLLFLDECTAGLDPDMAELTRTYLKDYNKETGCSILFTSHYMQEVERLCKRIAFMYRGKIIKTGSAEDLVKELNQQTVHLHFSKNIEKAERILKGIGIKFIKEGRSIRFQVRNRKKVIYPILKKFIHANVPFDDLKLEKPTLEDYFIKKSRE